MDLKRALVAAALLALAACLAPPPTAPGPAPAPTAQGYRAKTPEGVDLRFDPARAAFAVPTAPGTWWVDQRFYRRESGAWSIAPALDGPWTACPGGELPRGLQEGAR